MTNTVSKMNNMLIMEWVIVPKCYNLYADSDRQKYIKLNTMSLIVLCQTTLQTMNDHSNVKCSPVTHVPSIEILWHQAKVMTQSEAS